MLVLSSAVVLSMPKKAELECMGEGKETVAQLVKKVII